MNDLSTVKPLYSGAFRNPTAPTGKRPIPRLL